MAGLRGVFVGALSLIALETILSTEGAADRTAGAFGTVAGFVDHLLDPTVPAIPDRSGGKAAASSTASTVVHGLVPITTLIPSGGKPSTASTVVHGLVPITNLIP